MDVPVDFLQCMSENKLFAGVDRSTLKALVQLFSAGMIDKGEVFLPAGEVTTEFFLITRGQVQIDVQIGHSAGNTVAVLSAGDALGETSLARKVERLASAKALTTVAYMSCHADDLMDHFDQHPEIGYRILRNLAGIMVDRLRDTDLLAVGASPEGDG